MISVIIWEINSMSEDIFQRVFEGERTHWHLKLTQGSNWHFKVDNLNENVASDFYFGQIYMTTLIEKNLKNFALA